MCNRKFIIIILFSLFVFFVFYKGLEKPNNYLPEKNLNKVDTSLVFKNLNDQKEILLGELINNNSFSIINIWASWCLPCKNEHAYLLKLRNTNKINIIGINYKDTRSEGEEYLKVMGNPFDKIIFDPKGQIGMELGVYATPETFLISKEGLILHKHIGELSKNDWVENFLPLINPT